MGKVVVIVHPAELIRRGLSSVLEELHTVKIHCYPAFSEIKADDYTAAQKLMIIVPVSCKFTDKLLELRTKVGNHELIGLVEAEGEKYPEKVFDYILQLHTTADQVIKLAERFFKQDQQEVNDELTNREKEVLRLIALGNTNKTIADSLFISTHTVISHRKNITEKLGIKSIPGLTVYAIIQKIVDPSDISPDQLS